jgi:homoisocitrate dehydrogenase
MQSTSAPSEGTRPLRVLAIPGDGIGREVIPAAEAVLRATGLPIAFTWAEAGWECFERHGTSLPDETLAAARAADAILFGAVSSPSRPVAGYRSPIVALRRALDLYANIRPTTTDQRPPTQEWHETSPVAVGRSSVVDLVVVRENTEGLYAGRERAEDGGDTAIAERVITRRASERIARAAFELARARRLTNDHRQPAADQAERSSVVDRQPPKVTIVHKANVLRETCGLFRAAALAVAEQYPEVAVDELLVDSAALQLVQRPERFDVIVTTNLFGDILSDVASYWGGGLGMASSANIGDAHALFEPVHGSAPDIAGRGIANPLAAIGCAAMLLEHLANCRLQIADCGLPGAAQQGSRGPRTTDAEQELGEECRMWAQRIRAATRLTVSNGPRTPDLEGSATTEAVTSALIDTM